MASMNSNEKKLLSRLIDTPSECVDVNHRVQILDYESTGYVYNLPRVAHLIYHFSTSRLEFHAVL